MSKEELGMYGYNELSQEKNESKKERFNYEIKMNVPKETFDMWVATNERCKKLLGYSNESKVMEFVLIEFTNTPDESLQ